MTDEVKIPAAVVVPILVDEMRWESARSGSLLLTIRSEDLEHHKGQIAFPGGVKDEADPTLEATARREFEEELGVEATDLKLIGELSSQLTISSPFIVHPYIGLWPADEKFKPNPSEISALIEVPILYLLDEANSKIEPIRRGEVTYLLKSYYYEGHRIWGATARIITELLKRF